MDVPIRRFACTQCGKCCNRSPEVELSEAAGLADMFVFRLMFRVYRQPRLVDRSRSENAQVFYERKRLLSAHSARAYATRELRAGRTVEYINYLMISALALDTRPGACTALRQSLCSIYDRRPLGCRTVPFHYSRGETVAQQDLDTFVSTAGYRCDVGANAPIVLEGERITDPVTKDTRSRALAVAKHDLSWKQAILRAMKSADQWSLPTLRDIEANAALGALTTSMRVAWQIAARARLLSEGDARTLLEAQLATIRRELQQGLASPQEHRTLQEMTVEYAQALGA